MHRFDGLDLVTTLLGLICVLAALWLLSLSTLRRPEIDPEPTGTILEPSRYWAGVDLGNEHVGLSVYDSWAQRWVAVPKAPSEKSKVEAQMLAYQTIVDPDHPFMYIGGNEDQAEAVFSQARKYHDDVMRAWLDHYTDAANMPPYNWADDPDA